jgi:predicted DNA-binding protein (MmcQ/YjbR family)
VSVKCEPEPARQLRVTYAPIRPGTTSTSATGNTITVDGGLPDELIRDLVEDS